ncbi:aldo/keto reductase [Nonomuraea sediminis]|uniref:aldo/keto reductase n=1 Tax=Nonomuraea sediminis TaxID=2835864 RepID=UPI001BDCB9B6|nr:aldo/keto reductase [Nonomuraea sediminis]
MEHTTLGRSGLRVSRACLGTMNFGTTYGLAAADEAEAGRVLDAFLEAGGNFVDTADLYHRGETEEILGRLLKGRRERVVLATKGAMPVDGEARGLSRRHLTRALDASLRRLDTDYVDLYQCHQWDPATPIEETMATLDGFVRAGKVRYLGCSNFTAAQIVESQWAAATPFVSLQPQYSLLARVIETEVLPVCERHGLGTVVYGTLGGGILAGRYTPGRAPDPDSRMGRLLGSSMPGARRWAEMLLTDRNLAIAAEVTRVASELGAEPGHVALAWVARRPGVTSVLLGPRSVDQLRSNLAGLDLTLPPEVADRLTQLSDLNLTPQDGSLFHLAR